MKPNLCCSFSGGKTSAVMTKFILENWQDIFNIHVIFANTGCEHQATLNFIRDCDQQFNFNTVWLEAVVYKTKTHGVRHKIVNYSTAARNGEPFMAVIEKYGLPNAARPYCSDRVKVDVIESYLRRQLGWRAKSWYTAIGIRADEWDRCSTRAKELLLTYPLCQQGWTEKMVEEEVARWPFKLNIPGKHYGNCTWCWKKNDRKLLTLAKNSPEVFDFPKAAEAVDPTRTFFRRHRTVADIFKEASKLTTLGEYRDNMSIDFEPDMDVGSSCEESCEPFH